MSTTLTGFYVTGGTLPPGTLSYVPRQADNDLYEGLVQGEFCYVLHARQMGKSSLMVQTTARLRKEGVAVAAFELTALGQNLTVEQWYDGLLARIGRNLDLEDELEEYWLEHERLSPLQRFMGALREVVLRRCPGRLVLFLDEIDAVRSLPFSTDEFFAAIRECYNRRSQEPEFGRLTFCLLGVATPSDLIQDTRTTPFNIGRRIELTDFTVAEAAPLAQGLGRDPKTSQALLKRALYWTGGHPYLTQRLCQAVGEDETVTDPAGVDRLCEALFLSPQAQERDDNLLFVRERLLKSEADRDSLLDLYGQVRSGKRVRLNDTNQLVSLLRLSGITRVSQGALRVRNRIYARVFDRQWVTTHMPDAELRRQRAAFRQGLIRATAVLSLILAAMAGLVVAAVDQSHRAQQQRQVALEGQRTLRRYLYAAQLKVAQQAWEDGNIEQALSLLKAQQPKPGQEDLRGFEWRYLWRLCHQTADFHTFPGSRGRGRGAAFSPNGKLLAIANQDGTIRIWDRRSRRELAVFWLTVATGGGADVAFSPDGKFLAGRGGGFLKLWNVPARRELPVPRELKAPSTSVWICPDGKRCIARTGDRPVMLWDLTTRHELVSLPRLKRWFGGTALSPDGKLLAMGNDDNSLRLWDVARDRELAVLKGHTSRINVLAFSPDSKVLATGSDDSSVKLWNLASQRAVATLRWLPTPVYALAFSADGRTLAVGYADSLVKLWDVVTGQEVRTLRGHAGAVDSLAFSPDSRTLATASEDGTVKLWSAARKSDPDLFRGHRAWVRAVAFSPDGRLLASGSLDHTVKLWDVTAHRELATLRGHKEMVRSVAFSPDGRILAAGSSDGMTKLWDIASRRESATLPVRGHHWWIDKVVFSPDGSILATGSGINEITLWNIAARRVVATLKGGATWVSSVAFSPDGRTLASGSVDGRLKLWDIEGRREIASLKAHDVTIDVTFSPNGSMMATCGWEATVKLWDVPTRRLIDTLKGHSGPVDAVAFSPDGKTLVSASGDGTVRLWNVAMRQEVTRLLGHAGPATAVAFSPDGNTLATAGGDTTIRLWRAGRFEEPGDGRARLGQTASFQETDPPQVVLSCADRTVRVQWKPLPRAVGYEVYRGPAGATGAQLARLNAHPLADTSFTDRSSGVLHGHGQTYAVKAIYPGDESRAGEAPLFTLQASPVVIPLGWVGSSINEGGRSGSVTEQPASGEIILRGSGLDISDQVDGFYFLHQKLFGDFQITVKVLTKPTAISDWAQAGLMVRETLDADARHAALVSTRSHGLQIKWRASTHDMTPTSSLLRTEALRLPILLRLTRQGSIITPEYSTNNGKAFQAAGDPYRFEMPLPQSLYAGLAITAHEVGEVTEARFSHLQVQKR